MKVAILKESVSEDTNKPIVLGHIPYPNSDKAHQSNIFYDKNAVSPTLDTCEGGNRQVKILVEKDKLPLALDEQNKYIRTDGTVGTIMTDGSSPKHNNRVIVGGTQKHQAVKKRWSMYLFNISNGNRWRICTDA